MEMNINPVSDKTKVTSGEHLAFGSLVSNLFIQYMVLVLLCNINAFIRKQWTVTLSTGIYKYVPFEDQYNMVTTFMTYSMSASSLHL